MNLIRCSYSNVERIFFFAQSGMKGKKSGVKKGFAALNKEDVVAAKSLFFPGEVLRDCLAHVFLPNDLSGGGDLETKTQDKWKRGSMLFTNYRILWMQEPARASPPAFLSTNSATSVVRKTSSDSSKAKKKDRDIRGTNAMKRDWRSRQRVYDVPLDWNNIDLFVDCGEEIIQIPYTSIVKIETKKKKKTPMISISTFTFGYYTFAFSSAAEKSFCTTNIRELAADCNANVFAFAFASAIKKLREKALGDSDSNSSTSTPSRPPISLQVTSFRDSPSSQSVTSLSKVGMEHQASPLSQSCHARVDPLKPIQRSNQYQHDLDSGQGNSMKIPNGFSQETGSRLSPNSLSSPPPSESFSLAKSLIISAEHSSLSSSTSTTLPSSSSSLSSSLSSPSCSSPSSSPFFSTSSSFPSSTLNPAPQLSSWYGMDEVNKNASRFQPLMQYYDRMIPKDCGWRVTTANTGYTLCDTYPELLCVPSAVSDADLISIAQFRSRGRFPVMVWRHPQNSATVSRCAQPRVGLKGNHCEEDENLIRYMLETNHSESSRQYLLDARPIVNAMANAAMGAGVEDKKRYENVKIKFLGIDNIHAMRSSFFKLHDISQQSSTSSGLGWLSGLESSKWLEYVRLILLSAVKIVKYVNFHSTNVVIHCSDGWDRTPQLSSLSMLLMDPYYRTLDGFISLIEMEWRQFGHKFCDRLGHILGQKESEVSPVLLQFMDCVYQLLCQFNVEFEFNENLLLCIMFHSTSGLYGTFLCNTPKERDELDVASKTVSLWNYVALQRDYFTNPMYSQRELCRNDISMAGWRMGDVLIPQCNIRDLSVWKSFYHSNGQFHMFPNHSSAYLCLSSKKLAATASPPSSASTSSPTSSSCRQHGESISTNRNLADSFGNDSPLIGFGDSQVRSGWAETRMATRENPASRSQGGSLTNASNHRLRGNNSAAAKWIEVLRERKGDGEVDAVELEFTSGEDEETVKDTGEREDDESIESDQDIPIEEMECGKDESES